MLLTYEEQYLKWLLGAGDGSHPTNPIRAKLARDILASELGSSCLVVEPTGLATSAQVTAALKSIHSPEYVERVLGGDCNEWFGTKPEVAQAGMAMFAGTMVATRAIIEGSATVAFNPQGAKHHARYDRSAGFCVFNDMVWAALEFQKAGLKPLYLDWDIHAGDGVYHMLKGTGIPAISIHCGTAWPLDSEMQSPGRSTQHSPAAHAYNFNVREGEADEGFQWAVDGAVEIMRDYQPDVILLAAGADGHEGIGNLGEIARYTDAGFRYAAEAIAKVANECANGRVLIGGAGGYQPNKETPETWALVVKTIFDLTKKEN